jgi:hypothetical protein
MASRQVEIDAEILGDGLKALRALGARWAMIDFPKGMEKPDFYLVTVWGETIPHGPNPTRLIGRCAIVDGEISVFAKFPEMEKDVFVGAQT